MHVTPLSYRWTQGSQTPRVRKFPALAFYRSLFAQGLVEVLVLLVVRVGLQQTMSSPVGDGAASNTKLLSDLVAREHACFAKSLVAALEMIAATDVGNRVPGESPPFA